MVEKPRAANHFGLIAAIGTSILTAMTFAIAVMTPPRSGPFCLEGCYAYPFLNVASRFPRDYVWMAPACLAFLCYLAMMTALHAQSVPERRQYATLALVLAAMATVVLIGDYYLQLAAIQPSLVAAEPDGIAMLSQYNPHGVFIALEELGYLLMSLSLAVAARSIARDRPAARAVRRLFVSGFVVTMMLLVGIAIRYGHGREYRFEVAVISVNFLILIVGAALLAVTFKAGSAASR
jgi:hypothetical protein